MGPVLAIARMIIAYPVSGLAAFWHHLRHYLFPSNTLIDKPQSKEEQQNNGITRKVEGIFDEESCARIDASYRAQGMMSNSKDFDALEWRKPILNDVMQALADPNTHIIGVYGPNHEIKDGLLPKIRRRVDRDMMFDMVLTTILTYKPHMKMIQDEIAGQLGFNFSEKSEGKRANELRDRIKNEQKVLVILCDLFKGLDLGKVGIPFGADHRGCKILLTSTSEEVLSKMQVQQILMF